MGSEDEAATGRDELATGDLEALAATRRDLGADYEPALLEAFAERVERTIESRVETASEASLRSQHHRFELATRHGTRQFALAIVSVLAGIPLVLALALNDELPALVIALVALMAINASHASVGPPRAR